MFFRLKHIEAYGTGIQKIFSLYSGYDQQPSIKVSDSAFVMELPNINYYKHQHTDMHYTATQPITGKINQPVPDKQQAKVINYLRKNKSMTMNDVMELLGIKQTRAYIITKNMLENGFIRKEGRGKTKRFYL
jgi:ATP-dependent DNA helicase RecG